MTTNNQGIDDSRETTTSRERFQERLEKDETYDLISSEKVDGTPVVNRDGDTLGTIHHFMVGKRDGRVRYAVMAYGGFLGMGENYYPLPWDALTYDTDHGGYVVDMNKEQLSSEEPPSYPMSQEPNYDQEFDRRIRIYWLRTV